MLSKTVPDFVRRRLVVKFTIVVLVVALLVAGVGVFVQGQVSGTLTDQQQSQMRTVSELTTGETEQWLSDKRQTVRMMSQYEEIKSGNPSQVNSRFFYEAYYLENSTQDLYYLNLSTGGIEASTNNQTGDMSIDNMGIPWSQGTGLSFDNPQDVLVSHVFELDGEKVQAFASRAGETDYALVITVSASSRAESFNNAIEGGSTQIVNSSGIVQFDRDSGTILTQYSGPDRVLDPSRGSQFFEQEGRLIASFPIEGADMVVVSRAPTSNAYAIESTVTESFLILITIALAGFVLIGATIGRNTVRSLSDLKSKAQTLESGSLDTDIDSNRIDEIGALYSAFASMRDALQQQIDEAEQARKEAEVSKAEALEISNYLQEKADEYAETMQQCGAGDLTQRMDPDGENDAMDRIATEFNEMVGELEKTTGQLKTFADEVETAGEVVLNSSESVRDASEQVANSIQKISDDAYDQKERLQRISETMDEVATDLETHASEQDLDLGDSLDRIEEIANMLSDVVDLAEETMGEAENVAGAAEEQAAELNEVSERAQDLTRYASPLQDVLGRFETESEHEFYFPTGPGSDERTARGDE